MRKPFSCDSHPSLLRPAATPARRSFSFDYIRRSFSSSSSCKFSFLPSFQFKLHCLGISPLPIPISKSKSFRHPRGLNAHGAGLNAHGAGLNAHGAGLNAHGAVQINTNNRLIILQLPHDLHHHRRNSLLEIRQIPQVENSLSTRPFRKYPL
jgi:hypothetical protein